MSFDITGQTFDGGGVVLTGLEYPDRCPICHRHVQPKSLFAAWGAEQAEVSFQCQNKACQRMFIGTYRAVTRGSKLSLRSLAPTSAIQPGYPEAVVSISPTFVEIMTQVASAEALKLDQLVGIGLRKALEFLIKDFTIKEKPSEAEGIKKTMLGPVIDKYVDDTRIKTVAKRAAWLGNDETHYVRKWEDQDINDLRSLVKLTVNWIDSHLETKKYEGEMPGGK